MAASVRPALTVQVDNLNGRGPTQSQQARASLMARASAQAPAPGTTYDGMGSDYAPAAAGPSGTHKEDDQGGFSSDDDGVDAYASAQRRLKNGSASAGARATRQQQSYAGDEQYAEESDSSDNAGYTVRMDQEDDQQHSDDDQGYDDEDEEDLDDDMSSSPSIPDENIDFDLVYALHNFIATVEGQATVHKGNSLTLLDDSNSYWWLVRVLRTQEVGYIPAENIETPFERLARLNKHRNVDLTSATEDDHIQVPEKIYTSHLVKKRHAANRAGISVHSGKLSALSLRTDGPPGKERGKKRGVLFGPSSYLEHSGNEFSSDEEYDEDDMDLEGEDDEEEYSEEDEEGNVQQRGPEESAPGGPGPDRMEPDDGMDWDAAETERIQREQEAKRHAQEQQAEQQQMQTQQQQQEMQQQQQRQQQAQEEQRLQMIHQQQQAQWQAEAQQQKAAAQHARQQSQEVAGGLAAGAGVVAALAVDHAGNKQPQDPASLQSQRAGKHVQVSSVSSTGSLSAQESALRSQGGPDSSDQPVSSTSEGAFLPSQVQASRDRIMSDASSSSAATGRMSPLSPEAKQARRASARKSRSDDELTGLADEKATKKRSGVFSGLFSRNKEKKNRKSGSFGGSADGEAFGRSSEDSSGLRNSRGSPALGQSTGLGRSVQERDRAQQEAYQRQFLQERNSMADRSSSSTDMSLMHLGARGSGGRPARPGSLIATPGQVPMLNVLRIFAGDNIDSDATFKTVLLNEGTTSIDLVRQAIQRFRLSIEDQADYVLTVKLLDGQERMLQPSEMPLQVFDALTELNVDGEPVVPSVPSVKRSSVGSISSISSNLSLNPAIARLGNDFSDDHAVKFYLQRRPAATPSVSADESSTLWGQADTPRQSSLQLGGPETRGLETETANTSAASSTNDFSIDNSHTGTITSNARFSLRILIFPSDLPDGLVFDPQTNALIPAQTLADRGPSGAVPSEGVQQQYREKVLSFARNATVAEVIETGLDRFGIAEGVVEGGDDVEERLSRRRSRLRTRYGLSAEIDRAEKMLLPTSKVLEAYPQTPIFRPATGNRRSVDGKRRSVDASMLLGAVDDVRSIDPVFILRQVSSPNKSRSAPRPHSPTEDILNSKQEQRRQAELDTITPSPNPQTMLSQAVEEPTSSDTHSQASSRQDIIAAQRAAAHERRAAILGATRNTSEGIDVVLSDQTRIRSSRSLEGRVRYSYVPAAANATEQDISDIIEDVLRSQVETGELSLPAGTIERKDSVDGSSLLSAGGDSGAGLLRPNFHATRSDLTLNSFQSARSSPTPGQESPLSLADVHFEIGEEPPSLPADGVAAIKAGNVPSTSPLHFHKQQPRSASSASQDSTSSNIAGRGLDAAPGGGQGSMPDLLETFVRNPSASEQTIEERIEMVLSRVAGSQQPPLPTQQAQSQLQPIVESTGRSREVSNDSQLSNATGRSLTPTLGPRNAALASLATRSPGASSSPASNYSTGPYPTNPQYPSQGSYGSDRSRSPDAPSPFGTSSATHATSIKASTPLSAAASTLVGMGAPGVPGGLTARTMSPAGSSAGGTLRNENSNGSLPASKLYVARPPTVTSDFGIEHLYTIMDAAARKERKNRRSALSAGDPDGHLLNTQCAGLFAPRVPPIEERKVHEAYAYVNKELDGMDEALDRLLGDALRSF